MLDGLFANGAAWFTVPAIIGTGYLLITLLMDIGDADVDFDVDGGNVGHHSGDIRFLSIQSISAFLMGGGWLGLSALKLTEMGFVGASGVAVLAGVAMAWLFTSITRKLLKLQASGNVNIKDAMGLHGQVYIQIPRHNGGSGRVSLVISGRKREFDAVQLGEAPLASNTSVRVTHVDVQTNTLTVDAV
ncbi:MAG: hypothetical protein KDA20_08565 [Phycisphaerales bacterium]|nr:hypothetical protein [Phycisphaerales bacterium]